MSSSMSSARKCASSTSSDVAAARTGRRQGRPRKPPRPDAGHDLRRGPAARRPGRLVDDYAKRFDRTVGAGPRPPDDQRNRRPQGRRHGGRAALLDRALPGRARIVALDERGRLMTSPEFADTLARLRDDGTQDLAFVIGGADGIDPGLRARADLSLSFGQMVWPHMLARVMLTEQLYRAATILAGAPYHRA
ncbi:MAG: 23S rRNA (pseudouridine(1915)-N(3))-methyltransferase RlmH [Paracoccaceae bacterium]